MSDPDLAEIKTRLATVQMRLRNHYFADPDDCVWATEQVARLVVEVERLRKEALQDRADMARQEWSDDE
jgi:hypothetical protein